MVEHKVGYRLSREAEADLESILGYTLDTFGTEQFNIYSNLLRKALDALAEDPIRPSSKARPELGKGLRTFHAGFASRRQSAARHFIVYTIGADHIVNISRILHESMDLARHLPPTTDVAK